MSLAVSCYRVGRMEVTSTSRGKEALLLDGFRYRCHRKTEKFKSWVCANDKKLKCPGNLKTTPNLTILGRTSHTCTQIGTIEQEVTVKTDQCRKRAREELSVPVHTIFREEFGQLKDRGYDFVGHLPTYESMKTSLCRIRRKALGAEQNPVNSSVLNVPPEIKTFGDGTDFLKIDDSPPGVSRIMIFGVSDAKNALECSTTCFLDFTPYMLTWGQRMIIRKLCLLFSPYCQTNVRPPTSDFSSLFLIGLQGGIRPS